MTKNTRNWTIFCSVILISLAASGALAYRQFTAPPPPEMVPIDTWAQFDKARAERILKTSSVEIMRTENGQIVAHVEDEWRFIYGTGPNNSDYEFEVEGYQVVAFLERYGLEKEQRKISDIYGLGEDRKTY